MDAIRKEPFSARLRKYLACPAISLGVIDRGVKVCRKISLLTPGPGHLVASKTANVRPSHLQR